MNLLANFSPGNVNARTEGSEAQELTLVRCEDCGKEVSSLAAQCIHCGRPLQSSVSLASSTKIAAGESDAVVQGKPDADPQREERKSKKYIWYAIAILVLAGYWLSKGSPSPDLFFAGGTAKEACLGLANENKGGGFLFNDEEITADETWLKDGKRVVRLLQKDGDGLNQIMCVYGNGMVQIPSLLEQGRWR